MVMITIIFSNFYRSQVHEISWGSRGAHSGVCGEWMMMAAIIISNLGFHYPGFCRPDRSSGVYSSLDISYAV